MSRPGVALFLAGAGLALPSGVVLSSGHASLSDALTFLLGLACLLSGAVLGARQGQP